MHEVVLPPEWAAALQRIRRASSSPVLMPVALLAVLDLADRGVIRDGQVPLRDFNEAFASRMKAIDPKQQREGWRPFFHLSGRAGLWDLRMSAKAPDLSGLKSGKPRSAASLALMADCAQMNPKLAEALNDERTRANISQAISQIFEHIT